MILESIHGDLLFQNGAGLNPKQNQFENKKKKNRGLKLSVRCLHQILHIIKRQTGVAKCIHRRLNKPLFKICIGMQI